MKRNISKKFISLFIACLMLATLIPSAVMAESVNSLPPEKGNLIIHKFWMEDIGQAGLPNDGTALEQNPEGAEPLEGIEFTVEKIVPNKTTGLYPERASQVTDEMYDNEFESRSLNTDDAGIAKFENLPNGVYVVTETNSEAANGLTYLPCDPFLVSVPMTSPDGDGWLEDVHVYPKNEAMTPGKSANNEGNTPINPDPGSGEHKITWTITAPIPSKVDELVKYVVKDALDTRLDLLEDTVKVYTKATKSADADNRTAVLEQNYKMNFVEETNTLFITFDEEKGMDFLKDTEHRYVEVEFDTIINEEGLGQIIENDASLTFENKDGSEYEQNIPDPDRPKVFTGIIAIDKVNADDEMLDGAIFKVASSLENAQNGIFLKGPDGEDLVTKPVAKGKYELRGLYYGVKGDEPASPSGNKDFWIVEVQAPVGYSLLEKPVKVELDYAAVDGENGDKLNYFNKGMKIYNNKNGINLPMTGGSGIVTSVIAGLVVLAAVVVIIALRKNNSQSVDR